MDGRGFILCLVFPFRGRLPLVARVHRLFRLERNGYFFSPSLDSKIVDGRIRYRGGTVAKETRIIHTADRYMGRESIRIPVASATRYHAFRYSSHESISIGIPDACERLHHR